MKNRVKINDNIPSKLPEKKVVSKKRWLASLCIQSFTGLLAVFWLYSWAIGHLIDDRTSVLYKIIAGVVVLFSLVNIFLIKKWWKRLIWLSIALFFAAILVYWIGWDLYSDIRF